MCEIKTTVSIKKKHHFRITQNEIKNRSTIFKKMLIIKVLNSNKI